MKILKALVEKIKGVATEKQGEGAVKETVLINGKEV